MHMFKTGLLKLFSVMDLKPFYPVGSHYPHNGSSQYRIIDDAPPRIELVKHPAALSGIKVKKTLENQFCVIITRPFSFDIPQNQY